MKDRFFEAAKAAALVSEGVGKRKSFKHGAVIVKKNQMLWCFEQYVLSL